MAVVATEPVVEETPAEPDELAATEEQQSEEPTQKTEETPQQAEESAQEAAVDAVVEEEEVAAEIIAEAVEVVAETTAAQPVMEESTPEKKLLFRSSLLLPFSFMCAGYQSSLRLPAVTSWSSSAIFCCASALLTKTLKVSRLPLVHMRLVPMDVAGGLVDLLQLAVEVL